MGLKRVMVALRRPPDLPAVKKSSSSLKQMAARLARNPGVGQEEQGHYAKHRRQYVKPLEVQRLVAASECERVHALTTRSNRVGSFDTGSRHFGVQYVCVVSNC